MKNTRQEQPNAATSHFLVVLAPNKQTLEMEPKETEFFFDRPVTYIEAKRIVIGEGYQLANTMRRRMDSAASYTKDRE